ncbi:UDP-N-acetylmuramoyl-tripeptide--D-alanyl-D-alanine ligase [Rudanella lutea]|uniref:UDP-N-acetylmuramoyl-tripeptide--D-alanyl-D- alanine ligase n=1 Tax=Rudanella lutea TaxID=451374 RepID=UPI000368B446|nr:UDP-N-acetylmuramoyl-tripeptide--D-alanyl-D-alanine ligase [Rudanella lutea]
MTSTTDLYAKYLECSGVSTDTRQITPDCLFVALKGPLFDANTFAAEALSKGARYVVVDDPAVVQPGGQYLLVADGLTALQDLARHHRQTLQIPVVGLTGSNGKTTTKELIASVLSQRYVTYATRGNFNNHIGVPLTVLAITEQYEMAVVEMGANHQREIALLSSICQPTHGLITNVGKAHLEGFGGIEGVRKGKGELYDFLAQSGGTLFVNASDPTLMEMQQERQGFGSVVPYLDPTDPSQPKLLEESPVAVYQTPDGQTIRTHMPGRYNFMNMAAALAIGQYFGVTAEEANHAVAGYNPTNNRSQVVTRGTNTVLLDAYNANPSSMAAAITQFIQQPAERKMVILGDMYELGEESAAEHAALGKLIATGNFDTVILAGQDMKYALEYLPKAYYFPDKFSLHNWIADHPMQNTHVLIKGSRGMGLESVVPFI